MNLFLSYASAERDFARRLATDLSRHQVSVWWDVDRAAPGSDIGGAITSAIEASDWFAAVMSTRAVVSDWVSKEIACASQASVRIGQPRLIPLLLETCRLPGQLESIAYADFRGPYED